MGMISNLYLKRFLCRYNKEVGIPYYSYLDFLSFKQEKNCFINSKGIKIAYFYYYYDNYKQDKIILFCHGLGPGHTAYLKEIEELARRGYKVLTLDYTGCEESDGKNMISLLEPTRDVIELLNFLKLDKPVVLVGHSLGGFTSLNVINLRDDIKKAVILSGFLSAASLIETMIKSKFVSSRILKYESKTEPDYFRINNIEYLKNTSDKLFFIQSEDDQMVPYSIALKVVEQINNPNIKTLKVNNKKHNPNYSLDAVNYMNDVMGKYNLLIKEKKIKTDQDRINYFKDVSLSKLVEQDQEIFDQIIEFIEK